MFEHRSIDFKTISASFAHPRTKVALVYIREVMDLSIISFGSDIMHGMSASAHVSLGLIFLITYYPML